MKTTNSPPALPPLRHLDKMNCDEVQLARFFLQADARYQFVALQIEEWQRRHGRLPTSGQLAVETLGIFDERTLRRMIGRWREEKGTEEEKQPDTLSGDLSHSPCDPMPLVA